MSVCGGGGVNALFKISCIAAVVLGLVTHAFTYFNTTYLHDRNAIFLPVQFNSASRAKWMAQYVDMLTAFAYLPWLFGVLTLIFFALSVYMIVDVLDIQYTLNIWLIAGVCITDAAVINAHMYWPHEILAALPLALVSAWAWKKENWHIAVRMGVGIFFVGFSLACYGAYTSVAPCIVIISLFLALVDGQEWVKLFRRGIEYIITFLAGMVFYYIVLRLFLKFQNINLFSYGGEDRLVNGFPDLVEILGLIKQAWYSAFISLNQDFGVQMMVLLSLCLLIVRIMCHKEKIPRINFFFMFILIGIFPLAVGLIHVMAFGAVHGLMTFTYVMPFVGMIALLDRERGRLFKKDSTFVRALLVKYVMLSVCVLAVLCNLLKRVNGRLRIYCICIIVCAGVYILYIWFLERLKAGVQADDEEYEFPKSMQGKGAVLTLVGVLTVLMCTKVYDGVLTANIAYMQVDRMNTVAKSVMTRVLGQIEGYEKFEGYEEIVLIGDINENSYLSSEDPTGESTWEHWNKELFFNGTRHGMTNMTALKSQMRINTGLALPVDLRSADECSADEQKIIDSMPSYPMEGCITKIGDTIFVKMSGGEE